VILTLFNTSQPPYQNIETKGRLYYTVMQSMPEGLCNGTYLPIRLVIKTLYESGLDAMILGGLEKSAIFHASFRLM
jgi:hypothetical protein